MKPYYECHITFLMPGRQADYLEAHTDWKFSRIDGDPVMGAGLKCYLTKHFPASAHTSHTTAEADKVVVKMGEVANFLKLSGIEVIRQKVELVIFDTKANSEIR